MAHGVKAVGSEVTTRDVRLVYIQDPPPTISISVALMVRGAPGMRKSSKLGTANSSTHLQHEPRGDCFGSVAQPIDAKDSVDVRTNRRIGDPDLSGNLLVREPFGHQGENLRLARREMLPPRWYQNLRRPPHHDSSIATRPGDVKESGTFTPREVRMQRTAPHSCAYRADHPRKVASETNQCDAIDVERSGTNLVLAPPLFLPPVAASLTGPVEIATWAAVAARTIAATPAALAARAAPIPLGHDPVAVGDALSFLEHGLAGKVHAALAIDLGDLHVDLVADIDRVLDPLHALLSQLADVDQAVLVRHDLDEGAEGHDADHLAPVVLPHLDLAGQVADQLLGFGGGLAVDRADHDPAIVHDVDAGDARLFDDLADHLPSGADHFADLVGMDLHRDHPGRVLRHRGPRRAQRRIHLVHDEKAAFLGLLNRAGHGVDADALDLHVHLHGGDTLAGAGHFEVHVTQGILNALDIAQNRDLAITGDQAHRDPGHLSFGRYAGVHHRQAGAAYARHRCRTVGREDLGDEPDGVGEFLFGRHYRQQRPLDERTMADLTPPGRAERPCLADAEGREVVVMHEALELFEAEPVKLLLVTNRAEGDDAERLGLTPREQRRAVGAGEDSNLRRDRPDLGRLAPVWTHTLGEDLAANALLDLGFEALRQVGQPVREP